MADKGTLVHVEIFGQDYAVRGGDDPGYVERLASYVDEHMKEVSRAGGAVDSLRIAVLAALNIADERFQLTDEAKQAEARAQVAGSGTDERLAKLARQLDAALGK
jgi:cell division protein ZapA